MNLKRMCELAAAYTDRRDDFVTITGEDGKEVYDPNDDPGIWFEIMRRSINTAYAEAARRLLMPDMRIETELGENGTIDLLYLSPGVQTVKAVYTEDASMALRFDFETKYRIRVRGMKEGDTVTLQYHYVPDPLDKFTDEPEFPESLVDPMVYISRAAADIWLSERKMEIAQMWEVKYETLLRSIRSDMRSAGSRRIPKTRWR